MVQLSESLFAPEGCEVDDAPVKAFTWRTKSGFTLTTISYGAIIQSIKVPDKNGFVADVVLGFDDLESYVTRNARHFGGTIGRCANRIGGACFTIDGITYNVAQNTGKHHLHGGVKGFDTKNWTTTVEGNKVIFSYFSEDGEENYPGDLVTNLSYEVKDDDSLHVAYVSTTTKKTIVNLTNHSYFNLAGHDGGADELYNHHVTINADRITETKDLIPNGRLIPVGGTPYDLRVSRRLGDVLPHEQTLYDDNFCVNTHGNKDINFVSRVVHPQSGRYLEVYSDQPGVQFYTSNFLPAPSAPALVGKGGVGYRRHGAFCLETQNYPDAIHHENFPKAVLVPGEIYRHRVVYRFGVDGGLQPL